MAKIISFASWNVKHFHNDADRVGRVIDTLATRDPDLFAIYEVRGRDVYFELKAKMPGHNFFLTENTSDSDMELLIGFRRSLDIFVTQREEFRSKVPTLRPGALATVTIDGEEYSFLFLHVKSFADPRSWGLRDDMFRSSASLKRKLDRIAGGNAKFLVLGDLNTMGLNAAYNPVSDLSADQEIEFLAKRYSAVNMRLLEKTEPLSWWNGRPRYAPGSKLDHVFADETLSFKSFGGAEVEVIGWPEFDDESDQLKWIEDVSDHAML